MKIGRRTALKQIGSASAVPLLGAGGAGAQSGLVPVSVLLRAVDGRVSPQALMALLRPFATRDLPVGLLLDMDSPDPVQPATALADLLRRLAQEQATLVELVPFSPAMAGPERYFLARAASDLRRRIDALIGGAQGDTASRGAALSLAVPAAAQTQDGPDFNPVRQAGFRLVISLPDQNAPTRIEHCPWPAICANGGLLHGRDDSLDALQRRLTGAGADTGAVQLVVELAGQDGATMDSLAEMLEQMRTDGMLSPLLPVDLALRASAGYERAVALVLESPPRSEAAAWQGFELLVAALNSEGIAHGVVSSAPDPGHYQAGEPACLLLPAPPLAGWTAEAIRQAMAGIPDQACLAVDEPLADTLPLAEAGVRSLLHLPRRADDGAGDEGAGSVSGGGLDENGVLHLAPAASLGGAQRLDQIALRIGPYRDAILHLPPKVMETRPARVALVAELVRLAQRPGTRLVSLDDYLHALRPPDPEADRLWHTRAIAAETRPDPAAMQDEDAAALMADAWRAWAFFEVFTNHQTGLCPSTAHLTGAGMITHPYMTMWDIGSLIQGTHAAWQLGLINRDDYLTRLDKVLVSLGRAGFGTPPLPRGEISVRSPGLGTAAFNACDVGRLLTALALIAEDADLAAPTTALVQGWQLDHVVREGIIQSIERGRRVDTYISHCAHYTMRAFGHWGVAARSPYQAFEGASGTDSRMALLYQVGRIGPYGAEPLLMEGVETGFSPPSAFLAEVLFAAQLGLFASTGVLHCLSETPLPNEPWFSYQGLNVTSQHDPVAILTIDRAAQYRTPAFARANLMISSKAAFLWSALHPHDYSALLRQRVREVALTEGMGFATGVFAHSEQPTVNYVDVNTNGVILQALAHIHRGRTPALSLRAPPELAPGAQGG